MVKKFTIFDNNKITGRGVFSLVRAKLLFSEIDGKHKHYQCALNIARDAKELLAIFEVESFEILISLYSCGITRQRYREIILSDGSKNITEDEAKRLVEKCRENSYIFEITRKIALQMVGKYSLPSSLSAFIRYYLSGNFKKPTRKPPKRRFLLLTIWPSLHSLLLFNSHTLTTL